jgi:glycosyltransferase involved in cell wall biosynthesis
MLTYVIPTNRRPRELYISVRSIADQIEQLTSETEVRIIIVDNGSGDDSQKVINGLVEKYSFVSTIRYEDNIDYAVAQKRMMVAAPDSDWVWSFGDDDRLLPGALKFMVDYFKTVPDEVVFIHVAEASRISGTNGVIKGTLLDLCRNIGWIEMTGFITGNITRGKLLAESTETPRWRDYAKSAFVHSCALLEHLKDKQAQLVEIACIATQNKEQTKECMDIWLEQNIPTRYLYMSDCLRLMFEDGILTEKLPKKFFRYLNIPIWDRFIISFTSEYLNKNLMTDDRLWSCVVQFLDYLEEGEEKNNILEDIHAAKGISHLHHYIKMNLAGLETELQGIFARANVPVYPYSFLTPAE